MGVKHRQCPRCLACEDCGGCCCWMLDEDGEISADTVWPTQHGGLDRSAEVVVLNERKAMKPPPGRIVHYRLSSSDVSNIIQRRASAGHGTKTGNGVIAGDVFPAMIVRVWDEPHVTVQLQVFLDGDDTYWATSREEGDGNGTWSWPPREGQ